MANRARISEEEWEPAMFKISNRLGIEENYGIFSSDKSYRILSILISIFIVALTAGQMIEGGRILFFMDDAYILLHNVDVLRNGYDNAYVGVPAFYGATSTLHLIIAYICSYIPFVNPSYFIMIITSVAYALSWPYFCKKLLLDGFTTLCVTIFALCLNGSVVYFYNGLETGLIMLFLVWTVFLIEIGFVGFIIAIIAGAAPHLRPELWIVTIYSGLSIIFSSLSIRKKISLIFIALLACSCIYFIIYLSTGHLSISTASAKISFFAEGVQPTTEKIITDWHGFWEFTKIIYIALPFLLLRVNWGTASVYLSLFCGTLIGAFIFLPGAIFHQEYRYWAGYVPLLSFSFMMGLAKFKKESKSIFVSQSLAIVCLSVCLGTGNAWRIGAIYTNAHVYGQGMVDTAEWANKNLPEGAVTLIHDAGFPAYLCHLKLVDVAGLKTPWVVPINEQMIAPANHQMSYEERVSKRINAMKEIVNKSNPKFLISLRTWNDNFKFTDAIISTGRSVKEIYKGTDYSIYEIKNN